MIQHIKTIVGSSRVAGWLRWVALPLCLASMLAFSVANSAPADAVHVKPRLAVDIAASGVGDGEVQELKARLKELEDLSRQNYALELEGQRKKIDWWLTFIGVMAAIMAIGGALIPFLMARKDKEIIEQDKKSIEQDKAQTRQLLEEVKGMKADAKDSVEEIHRHEEEAKAAKETVLAFQSGVTPASDEETREAVEIIEQDKTADPLLRLRAEAVAASQSENAEKAFRLWAALAELSPEDANAQFNAGYWAGLMSQECAKDGVRHYWLNQAKKYSEKALSINPSDCYAAYNWGVALLAEGSELAAVDAEAARNFLKLASDKFFLALDINPDEYDALASWGMALSEEASLLFATEPEAARRLWKLAGEKYRLALNIKPDMYSAISNWSNALVGEANAIAESEPEESKCLLEQAEQLLLQHAEAAPDVVTYNLACVYGRLHNVQSCLHWLKVAKEHKALENCEHMRNDQDLDPVRNDPEFIDWLEQACPTQAAATQDNKA